MRGLILAGVIASLLVGLAVAPAASSASSTRDVCANRLCTKRKPGVRSCHVLFKTYAGTARCFITRAARHFGQSRSQALYIAHRESRYQWWVTNRYGYAGLYQFGMRLWNTTPYRKHSRLEPRWNALAAMWVWRHGGYRNWTCC